MKALIFENNKLRLVDKEKPVPENGEVLIKVRLAGICNTDLEILKGYLNYEGILGHEFVGSVVYDPEDILTGKRVVGSINIPCNECSICKKGLYNHCLNIKTLGMRGKDGVFAEYITLPRENLYPVPDNIPDQIAVFTEPMASVVEITEKVHLKPTDEIVILGDGKLGLLTAQTLWAMGFDVKIIGKHEAKLNIVKELGIQTYYLGEFKKMVQVVIDCTGSNSGLKKALNLVEPEGKIILKTTTSNNYGLDLSQVAVNELKIIGSRCGPFAPTLRLLARNKLPIEKMVDSVYPLQKGIDAFQRAGEKGVLKVLLKIE